MNLSTNPFFFGKLAQGEYFTDREKDTKRILSNFNNGINTILMSPRRWGKSSLVCKAGNLAEKNGIKVVYLDAFFMRNEFDFYTALTQAVIKVSSSKIEEWIELVKQFFKQIVPKIVLGADPTSNFSITFDWEEAEKHIDEILDLPNKIAQAKQIKIIICIDEFQNIAFFQNSLAFQKQLRSIWQKHQFVSYCLYGSKFHMMQELFERQSMPFYRFGDLIHLEKISEEDWRIFINKQFQNTGKSIDNIHIENIIRTVECHSYYVQQLSHLIWEMTGTSVTSEIFTISLDDMLNQNSILYQRDTEDLSSTQLNFLKAVASGETKNLNSSNILKKYHLGTSANVTKIKKQLINKEIIDIRNKEVSFIDPMYALWFKREVFTKIRN